MSEFASGFWDLYIALVTLVSIVACAVFLKSQSVRKVRAEGETTGHTWDEDLAEYNNPLPKWWSWLFYITIVFSLIYLVLYPGLGTWPGTLGWSQVGQLQDEQSRAEKQFGPIYQKFAALDKETNEKVQGALTAQQRKQWKQMIGAEFKLEQQGFGGGGFGNFKKKKKADNQ